MSERDRGLRLWLIRHGQTAANDSGWIQGRLDIPLNERGFEQARLLGERMVEANIGAIYSSPQRRALETAAIIGQRLQLPVTALDQLAEIDMGSWEKRPFADITGAADASGRSWVFGPDRHILGSSETLADLVRRAESAVATISAEYPEGDVCVVGHAGIALGVIGACLGLSDGTFLPPILIGNASISLLEHRLGRWLLLFSNDQHHLGPAWSPPDDMMLTLFGKPDGVEVLRFDEAAASSAPTGTLGGNRP